MNQIVMFMSLSLRDHIKTKLRTQSISDRVIDDCLDEWFNSTIAATATISSSASSSLRQYEEVELYALDKHRLKMICENCCISFDNFVNKRHYVTAILKYQAKHKPPIKKRKDIDTTPKRSRVESDSDDEPMIVKKRKDIDTTTTTPERSRVDSDDDDDDEGKLNELKSTTKNDLKKLCREKGFALGGNKQELIDRLMGKSVSVPKTPRKSAKTPSRPQARTANPKTPSRPPRSPKSAKSKQLVKTQEQLVKEFVTKKFKEAKEGEIPHVTVEKVINGKTYDIIEETGYVFADDGGDEVVSILDNGQIRELTQNDIDEIKKAGYGVKDDFSLKGVKDTCDDEYMSDSDCSSGDEFD
jgi:SAP domain